MEEKRAARAATSRDVAAVNAYMRDDLLAMVRARARDRTLAWMICADAS
jgi:hypothetical protein